LDDLEENLVGVDIPYWYEGKNPLDFVRCFMEVRVERRQPQSTATLPFHTYANLPRRRFKKVLKAVNLACEAISQPCLTAV